MAHNYEIGTKAWQPDTTEGWVASELVSKTLNGDKYTLVFQLENGEVCYPATGEEPHIFVSPSFHPNCADFYTSQQTKSIEATEEALTQANNASLPPLMNPTMLEASDDLTNLSHLNEPAGRSSNTISLGSLN